MKKAIIFLADGAEEVEALAPLDMLRRAGVDVTLAGVGKKEIVCSHGVKITADACLCDAVDGEYDMVVLPGGGVGTENLGKSAEVEALVRREYENGKIIAAICAAPSVLGGYGLLKGKSATCYPGFEEKLTGALLSKAKVVRDGNIITSRGAGTAMEFAFELVEALIDAEAAEKIRKAVMA